MKIDIDYLKQSFKNIDFPSYPDLVDYRLACVFMLLFEKEETNMLTILKSDTKGYPWRNQVAFPGGHIDKNDPSSEHAVFRELEEELNISADKVIMIGSIGHFQTINNTDIEVFLGIWNGKGVIQYDTQEISEVIEIPIKKLVDIHRERNFYGHIPDLMDLIYPFKHVWIWGVTARIIHYFIENLYPLINSNS